MHTRRNRVREKGPPLAACFTRLPRLVWFERQGGPLLFPLSLVSSFVTMGDFITDGIVNIIRAHHEEHFAHAVILAGALCDLPDGAKRLEDATEAARELRDSLDARKNRRERQRFNQVVNVGESMQAILKSAVEKGVEWPVTNVNGSSRSKKRSKSRR